MKQINYHHHNFLNEINSDYFPLISSITKSKLKNPPKLFLNITPIQNSQIRFSNRDSSYRHLTTIAKSLTERQEQILHSERKRLARPLSVILINKKSPSHSNKEEIVCKDKVKKKIRRSYKSNSVVSKKTRHIIINEKKNEEDKGLIYQLFESITRRDESNKKKMFVQLKNDIQRNELKVKDILYNLKRVQNSNDQDLKRKRFILNKGSMSINMK